MYKRQEHELLLTLPKSGMIANGRLSEQTKLELGIEERESGLWHILLSTGHSPAYEKRYPNGGTRKYPISNLAAEVREGIPYSEQVKMRQQMFPTPRKMYGTPKEQDSRAAYMDRGKSNLGEQIHGEENVVENGGQLNPNWVEWLMGFPIGWTDLKDSETP